MESVLGTIYRAQTSLALLLKHRITEVDRNGLRLALWVTSPVIQSVEESVMVLDNRLSQGDIPNVFMT